MPGNTEPRLVLRFAIASLVAFVLVGVGATVLMVRNARERAELTGARHAAFISRSVLPPVLQDVDLSQPVTGEAYDALNEVVRERVLSDGQTVRVKIWRLDGTIVYSDEHALVGVRFTEEVAELEEVAGGVIERGVSDLDEEENAFERGLADKLFYTYMPLQTEPGGPVVAVAEIYQDYAFIQQDIDAVVHRIALVLVAGFAALYAILLPIEIRASRELRMRNERLNELLQREQRTVAELRDLNQKKDDFVGAVSHELRTPLTSIVGSLATLKRPELGGDPSVREELLGAAERQTRRLGRVIANLLSAAHLDGARPNTLEPVDLGATARIVAADLDATERVRIDTPRPQVSTDRDRIAQVLTYLLDNAIKYSPEDSPIDVGASVEAGCLRVWVTDRGVGIDPADQIAIFDRFHQVDQSATRRHGGLGLGLHLARDLVHELGGRIEVASTLGRGSTFTVTVPAKTRSVRERTAAADGPNGSGSPRQPAMNAETRATSDGI